MPRARTNWSVDEERGVLVGFFHELRKPGQTWTPRYDLCSTDEFAFKQTSRGKVRRSEKEQTELIARLKAEKLKALLAEKPPVVERKGGPLVLEVMDEWLAEVSEFRDPGTLRMYKRAVALYREAVGDHSISEFASTHNRRFGLYLDKVGLSLASQHKYLSYIRTFFGWAAKRNLCQPTGVTVPSRIKREPKVYSTGQLAQIREAILKSLETASNKRRRVMRLNQLRAFEMATKTAMRAGELINLRLENIDLEKRTIRIRATEDWKPKADKERDVPISMPLTEFLASDLAGRKQGEVWFLDEGDGVRAYRDSSSLGHPLAAICKKLGVSGVKPWHGIRASVITNLLEQTGDLPRVQKLAGHTDIQTTRGYLNTDRLGLQELVDLL
ncbi:MAG: hypothetical protein A2600_04945 [Candidatus Lambdaproteobacteria bacterium RIFOXYD1_FULL_56_27]|uniref:Tyr recombinase domain-containing protein n=1 Tax=Candidatus Lambdaproteobacteria bacterium RIFOXYD2_FULL_56_26 TaxID=1817773 RepID=A0A1F6GRT2_9PROT|nr:MAG: hypothetical protein A2426_07800 [Candidatus Lambdaproteobacteria bacterium RIFOXYC1_FULL_56_13]OGH00835.1 MAG: hypothetical protein A2557_03940 [Candidatus Lambdaproteobacteria bacterium RIFOXYD2_FULL_56_26]OGH09900.1 MAG: hypothetical protein A2600_04945 [Candidatus Lambdaproteobacteria bacterium RIFOXYD1_FULL_56_27]